MSLPPSLHHPDLPGYTGFRSTAAGKNRARWRSPPRKCHPPRFHEGYKCSKSDRLPHLQATPFKVTPFKEKLAGTALAPPTLPAPARCRAELLPGRTESAVEFYLRIMTRSAAGASRCSLLNLCGKTRCVNYTFAAGNRTSDTFANNVTYVIPGREPTAAPPRSACETPPSVPAASARSQPPVPNPPGERNT